MINDITTPGSRGASPALCAPCDSEVARPYDEAWKALSTYLHEHWKDIVRRGSFDLSAPFGSQVSVAALRVHLHFVKRLGGRLASARINVDLSRFAAALKEGRAHPEVTLLIADCTTERGKLLLYDAEVSVLKRDSEVYSAICTDLTFPIAVKVCYLKASAPVSEPDGFPWHPTRQRKLVKLSPYKGDTRPVHARRDLRL